MSCAGVWSDDSPGERGALDMLTAFANPAWPVQSRVSGVVALAVASRNGGVLEGPSPGLCLAGDLRLHNRRELADLLGLDGASDGQTAIEAYRRWGLDFARRLLGDFAFCLWDEAQRRLLLVRDAGGACPMFYTHRKARVAFCSHPRGLLSRPGSSRQLNERAVLDYLGEFPQEEEATLFAEVRRLPPGHLLVVDERKEWLVAYFRPTEIGERRLDDERDYAVALRETLARAVACRLPPERRLAVMLSGGLDSSTVAALAASARPREHLELHTISAVFPDFAECDERSFQALVVDRVGSRHHRVSPSPDGAAGDFERLCRIFSDPSFIGPHWIAWSACESARNENVGTMMTGIDGDRVVSHGAGRFGDLARARDWAGLRRELGAVHDFDWRRRIRVGAAQILLAELPGAWSRTLDRLDVRFRARLARRTRLLRSDALRRHGVLERLAEEPRRARTSRDEHLRALVAPDRNWDVELLEQLGTAFDIRFEQPFFDRRVVELCVSFPGSQKRQHGWSRYVLRQAMRGHLPDLLLDRRTDAAFDRPYWAWARRWLEGQSAQFATLDNISDYVDVPSARRLLTELPISPDGGPVDFLWKCVVLSRWLDAVAAR